MKGTWGKEQQMGYHSVLKDRINAYNALQQKRYYDTTGIMITDIQETLFDQSPFAVRIPNSYRTIRPGLSLSMRSIDLVKEPGAFTNYYELQYDTKMDTLTPTIVTRNSSIYLRRLSKNSNSRIAGINGGFFYYVTNPEENPKPKELTYNLCVRKGKVYGLPAWDRPALFTRNGRLEANEMTARGTVEIGGKKITWVGANSQRNPYEKFDAILFNSACCSIISKPTETSSPERVLDLTSNFTPFSEGINLVEFISKPI